MMRIGVLIFPKVEELDFVGPWEMLATWKQFSDGQVECILVAQTLEPVTCANGLTILPQVDFAGCPALDCLLVPGGMGTRVEVHNQALVGFVVEQARRCRAVLSVCTGAFVLHAAGLLSGRRATTQWESLDRLRALGDVEVVEERWTWDGRIGCAAGVSAGIDLTLRWIAEVAGHEMAGRVQYETEYYPDAVRYGSAHRRAGVPGYIRDE